MIPVKNEAVADTGRLYKDYVEQPTTVTKSAKNVALPHQRNYRNNTTTSKKNNSHTRRQTPNQSSHRGISSQKGQPKQAKQTSNSTGKEQKHRAYCGRSERETDGPS